MTEKEVPHDPVEWSHSILLNTVLLLFYFLFLDFLHIVGLEPELTQFENAPPTIRPQGPRCPSAEYHFLNPAFLRVQLPIRLFHNKGSSFP